MKLRTHLVALVLVAVVPIVLFATVVVVLLWQTDRRGTEERLRNTARALALAVDREVVSAVSSLEILAAPGVSTRAMWPASTPGRGGPWTPSGATAGRPSS
jgi:sensor domain CHASE-containing protein